MGGKKDQAKGRTKQAVGVLTGDEDLERQGRLDEDAGRAKQKVDAVIDSVREEAGKVAKRLHPDEGEKE